MSDPFDWQAFSRPSVEWKPGTDLMTIWRNYRWRLLPKTIKYHNDELRACVLFPRGLRWRKAAGLEWCPYCNSISPKSLLNLISTKERWDPNLAYAEMRDLVAKGEMDPSSVHPGRASKPADGTAYGGYTFNTVTLQPVAITIVMSDRRDTLVLGHIEDTSARVLNELIVHLNRVAPDIMWTRKAKGGLLWSHASPSTNAVITEVSEDGDGEDPQA